MGYTLALKGCRIFARNNMYANNPISQGTPECKYGKVDNKISQGAIKQTTDIMAHSSTLDKTKTALP